MLQLRQIRKPKSFRIIMTFVLSRGFTDAINCVRCNLDGEWVSSRWVPEKRPLPLEASIAHKTLLCAIALS
jgi:hypothetical protein